MIESEQINGLSELEISHLKKHGFLNPFPSVLDHVKIEEISEKILKHMQNRNDKHPIYGRYSVRDWHLVYPEILNLVFNNKILAQLKSIMGKNLLLWRSNVFYKPPGTGPIGWHQEFGTFCGEDIGNNKVSLLPTHLEGINEGILEQYLPNSLKIKSPESAPDLSDFWNMTLWVALSDIDEEMGTLRFLKGSHITRYPVQMGHILESDFWQDPFKDIKDKSELIAACHNSSFVLDVDTSKILVDVNIDEYSFEGLKIFILSRLGEIKGSITNVDSIDHDQVVAFPMKKGSYVLFSERTMHGSSANTSEKERLAINFRITPSTTLIYPFRLKDDYLDGFNLNVEHHKCIILSGKNLNPSNEVITIHDYTNLHSKTLGKKWS